MVSTGENTIWRIIGMIFLFSTLVIPIIIYYSMLNDIVASCPNTPQPNNIFEILPFMVICSLEAIGGLIAQLLIIVIIVAFVWFGLHVITFIILLLSKIWKSKLLLLLFGFIPLLVTWIFFISNDIFSDIGEFNDLIAFLPLILNTILILIGIGLRLFTSSP